jgi:hypothetical protein
MPIVTPFLDRRAEGKFESQFFRNSEHWVFLQTRCTLN